MPGAGRAASRGRRKGHRQRARVPGHGAPPRGSAGSSRPSASRSVVNPVLKRPSRKTRAGNIDSGPLTHAHLWQLALEAVSDEDELQEDEWNEALDALSDEAGAEAGALAEGADPVPPCSSPPGQPSPPPAASSSPLASCRSQSPEPCIPPGAEPRDLEPCISPGAEPRDRFWKTVVSAMHPVADVAPTSAGSTVDIVRSPSGAADLAPRPSGRAPLDPLEGKCRCRGNCGLATCKAAKNRRFRGRNTYDREVVICHVPLRSRVDSFCPLCVCEACADKGRQGKRGFGRFCGACAAGLLVREHLSLAASVDSYVNRNGAFYCEDGWTWELKMTARVSYLTEACLGLEEVYWQHLSRTSRPGVI